MVSSLSTSNFKECVIPHILALITKWGKLLPLRYLSLKCIHSSIKFAALEICSLRPTEETIYFFVFLVYWIFSIVTLPAGSYMSQVSKECSVFGYFSLFSQSIQSNLDWKYRNDRIKKLKKRYQENISDSLGKLRGKMKRSFLIN